MKLILTIVFLFFAAYYTLVRNTDEDNTVDAKQDRKFIDLLFEDVEDDEMFNKRRGGALFHFFQPFYASFIDQASYLMDHTVKIPNEAALWRGLMMILSVAMTNIQDVKLDASVELEPLLKEFWQENAEDSANIYAMGFMLFVILRNKVRSIWIV